MNLTKGINKKLIAVKINYFFQFCAISSLFIYMNPILATYGLNSYQLGITSLFSNAFSCIARITFGMIADRTKHRNYVLVVLSSTSLGLMLLFLTIPRHKEYVFNGNINENGGFVMHLTPVLRNESQSNYVETLSNDKLHIQPCWPTILKQCHSNDYSIISNDNYHLKEFNSYKLSNVYVNDNNYSYDTLINQKQQFQISKTIQIICSEIVTLNESNCTPLICEHIRDASWSVVLFVLILRCLINSAHAPISNLLDSVTFSILGSEKAHFYGRSRALGSFGFMIGSLLTGFAVHQYTPTNYNHSKQEEINSNVLYYTSNSLNINPISPNYIPAVIIAAISVGIGTIASGFCNYDYTKSIETHFTKALTTAIRSPIMIQCLMVAFITGLIISFIGEYNYLILTTVYHVPHYFLGLLTTIAIIVEIPTLLFISGIMVKHFGAITCQVISQIMLTIRFLFYAYSINYWYLLIGEIAYGISYPILMNALLLQTEKVNLEKVNENYQILASLQAILTSTMYGLSSSLGGLIWGLLLQYFNARSLFFIAFIYTLICTLLFPLFAYCLNKLKC
ncbi:major facilitator superfamily domain-containing 6-like [Schistosoma japonicum]|nr:major facilitator superfamily domain-containing 6-like [Schistosoma japonicum]